MNENKLENQIRLLINPHFYFLESVFILFKSDRYRLVVIAGNKCLFAGGYETERGAKIAFGRMFNRSIPEDLLRESQNCKWSDFYLPDSGWLEEKLKLSVSCSMERPKEFP